MQWVIQRRSGKHWHTVKFIHSTKDWLAYRLKGLAPPADAERLLEGLPDTFDEWWETNKTVVPAFHDAPEGEGSTAPSRRQQSRHETLGRTG
jgi:hypothetical protein